MLNKKEMEKIHVYNFSKNLCIFRQELSPKGTVLGRFKFPIKAWRLI